MMPAGISDLTRPIDLRRRRARRRRRIVIASAVALVVVIGAVVQVVGYSSVMAVRHVEVQGTGAVLGADAVRAAARVPQGAPLARVDLKEVTARVAALPPVDTVQVHRHWPDTIRIEVTQRTPVLQLRNGDQYLWVDRSGVVFHTSRSLDAAVPLAVADPGNQQVLAELATTVAALSPTLRRQIDHLTATGTDQIVVMLTGDRRIIWGSADQSAEKSTVATAMLATRASVYDVSAPDHPTAR